MRCLLLLFSLAVSCCLAHTLGVAPISVLPSTQRLVDESFREVFFHGVNVVVKGFPWIPDTDEWSPLYSFSEKDMQTLQDLGLNCIRLGTMWPGVEPVQGQYNRTYLQLLHDLVNKSASYGIYSLLDMHQDVLSEKFCGEGVPMWAALPDDRSSFPFPLGPAYNVSSNGVPSDSDCLSKSWSEYYFTKAAGTAFQHLYNNTNGLRDSWASFWTEVASTMSDLGSAVLGYELMNEPWSGDAVDDLLLMIPGVADRVNLQPMWEVGAAAIRSVDTSHSIFFEGVTWDWFNVGFTQVPGGSDWQNKSVLSYHYYVPPDFNLDVQFQARMDDIKRLQCGGFLTESWIDSQVMDKCDQTAQSWMMWEYKPFRGNRTGWSDSIWFNNGSMNMEVVSVLSRTYAQVVAGTTVTSLFNTTTKVYQITFRGNPLVTANETKIYLNELLHYPNGFIVNATTSIGSQYVTWWQSSLNHVSVQHNMELIGANESVSISVIPL